MKHLVVAALVLVASACSSGLSQADVDAAVDQAVQEALSSTTTSTTLATTTTTEASTTTTEASTATTQAQTPEDRYLEIARNVIRADLSSFDPPDQVLIDFGRNLCDVVATAEAEDFAVDVTTEYLVQEGTSAFGDRFLSELLHLAALTGARDTICSSHRAYISGMVAELQD